MRFILKPSLWSLGWQNALVNTVKLLYKSASLIARVLISSSLIDLCKDVKKTAIGVCKAQFPTTSVLNVGVRAEEMRGAAGGVEEEKKGRFVIGVISNCRHRAAGLIN